jgi:regulator of replication initiation timing
MNNLEKITEIECQINNLDEEISEIKNELSQLKTTNRNLSMCYFLIITFKNCYI